MSLTISEFFERLRKSEVLVPEEVELLLNRVPHDKRSLDADRVVAKLVEAKKLTQYQATALLEGRGLTLAMGDYVIQHRIGAGGMGQVFQARHRRLKRSVALKVLPPEVTQNEAAIKRFQREMEAAAKLTHPNIVVAHDAREDRGVHYLVMEYVAGDDLANLVKKYGPLPVEAALDYVIQAAQGLAHAHRHGVIHRDIKPANLLLDSGGTVKILDWGLVRFERTAEGEPGEGEPDDGLTKTGSLMGTADFMAPEQALDTKHVDARADVYSLGCTLYYLLTGRAMYQGETYMQRLVAHREQPIPALANERDDLPQGLAAVFERMVAKRSADRLQTMDEVGAALALCRAALVGSRSESAVGANAPAAKNRPGDHASFRRGLPPPLPPPLPGNTVASQVDSGTRGGLVLPPPHPSEPAAGESWLKRLTGPGKPWRRRLLLWLACVLPAALLVTVAANFGRHWFASPAKQAVASVDAENSLHMKFVYIPPGAFDMGSPDSEPGRHEHETLHRVRLTKGFYLGAHEVTVAQFREFVNTSKYKTDAETDGKGGWRWNETKGSFEQHPECTWQDPGYVQGEDHPVVNVSWNDARAFCDWLSNREKRSYRLPTEAEWEYACRAGTKSAYAGGDDREALARYGNVLDATARAKYASWKTIEARDGHVLAAPIGQFQPNAFGLFDLHGNVWEWCEDWYGLYSGDVVDPKGAESGTFRLLRGGSWFNDSENARSARRGGCEPDQRAGTSGFRVAFSRTP